MKNILIAREKNRAKELAEFLKEKNFNVFIAPLLSTRKIFVQKDFLKLDLNKISAVILTSANACFALKKIPLDKNIKIYAVGRETAKMTQKIGFQNVEYPIKNSAQDLKNLINKNHKLGDLLYLKGKKVKVDFAKTLAKNNLKVRNLVVYKNTYVKIFPRLVLNFFKENKTKSFDWILIYSQDSLKSFYSLVKNHKIDNRILNSTMACFSEEISKSAKKLGFKKVKTFAQISILKKFYE